MLNILTIDVEDYFHPTEVGQWVKPRQWASLPSRVEASTHRVLHLLARHNVKGTFFVLGWVAHRYPGLVREIASAGHEIGCHSYAHRLVYDLSPSQFLRDTRLAVRAIEDASGLTTHVYRAPSFSVTSSSLWALEALVQCGFTHDCSIYPIRHDRYGIPNFGNDARVVHTSSGPIMEVPAATVRLFGRRLAPVGGGAYFRLLPYRYTAAGIRRLNRLEGKPACLYFHPWELDSEQPRLARGWLSQVRTYVGLAQMESKLRRLLTEFEFTTVSSIHPKPENLVRGLPEAVVCRKPLQLDPLTVARREILPS